jgi:hypothetical protein
LNIYSRRTSAKKVRDEATDIAFLRQHNNHITNGEEATYSTVKNGIHHLSYIANYSKGLKHDNNGDPDPVSYESLVRALNSGKNIDFENIEISPLFTNNFNEFHSPQSGLAFDLEGPDAASLTIPPAPRIDSLENSAEMIELYWKSKFRDINFAAFGDPSRANYEGDTLPSNHKNQIDDAIDDLNEFDDEFKGPKIGKKVTKSTLFRGLTNGDLLGPYLSQFLILKVPYGTLKFDQKERIVKPGKDYLTTFTDWLNVQNGDNSLRGTDSFNGNEDTVRHIITPRDLTYYVHFDALYEAYLNACLILLGMNAPADPGNPYTPSNKQTGFATFGGPHILSLVCEVATRALKAVWFQKWNVHRRLRPEELGGRIYNVATNTAYKIDKKVKDIIEKEILDTNYFSKMNPKSYLLSQAFPEGCPPHPAYGAGHATVAGACVTILKAWFDESFVIPDPKVPDKNGNTLINYTGSDKNKLTVGGELNKVASNIALGRDWAGVHWRSDGTEGLKLGESVAIGILQEQKNTYNEDAYFSLTKFDGTGIQI